jgi:hypothetical protein
MSTHQFWFRSSLFEIEPGEDEETNPLRFGRQLARWLRERLVAEGRAVEEVVPEDWGWCLVVQRKPFLLWVGCVGVHDYAISKPGDQPPCGSEMVWAAMSLQNNRLSASSEASIQRQPSKNCFGERLAS